MGHTPKKMLAEQLIVPKQTRPTRKQDKHPIMMHDLTPKVTRADSEVNEGDITPSTSEPIPVISDQSMIEAVAPAPVKQPIAKTPATAGYRRVTVDTGEMQWLDSKSPEVSGASEWKYPLDTVFSSTLHQLCAKHDHMMMERL
jgi:hypothetical protein